MTYKALDKLGKFLMMTFGIVTVFAILVIALWIAIPVYIMRKTVQKLSL